MTQDAASDGRLVLEGALTIRTVDAACATLREAVTQQSSVSIDCSAADEVDLSFVQLLIAARASARLSDKTVVLAARPDGALLDALTRGGFRIVNEDQSADGQAFWFKGTEA